MKPKVLVTGSAGFIGFHLINRIIKNDYEVIGLDNINDYYDVNLKFARLSEAGFETKKIAYNELLGSRTSPNYHFIKLDLKDKENIFSLFEKENFDYVVNLAAQAGVRYSIENPYAYLDSNIYGFMNILEACRTYPVKHLIYASSSSVYGANKKQPFSVDDSVDHPISLYASTKKSNELMAHTYSALFSIPATGLRFFTVYGPWGRPDMAYYKFTRAIDEGRNIDVYNYGKMKRDFTYIDDITEAINKIISKPPIPDVSKKLKASSSFAPYKIYNIGNNNPVELSYFIELIENELGKTASKTFLPMQPGDVHETFADIDDLVNDINYKPDTPIEKGIKSFVDWYSSYALRPVK